MPTINATVVLLQIAEAVAHMHQYNIIHRDLKVENVVLVNPAIAGVQSAKPLRVKLIDLGMATLYNPDKPIRGLSP